MSNTEHTQNPPRLYNSITFFTEQYEQICKLPEDQQLDSVRRRTRKSQ